MGCITKKILFVAFTLVLSLNVLMFLHSFNNIANEMSCVTSSWILTLTYVKPGGLREAIYDEFEGLRCSVHCPCQFLNTAAPNLAFHALSEACTSDMV